MKKTILFMSLYFIMLFCLTACGESKLEFNQYTIPENVIVTENTTKDVYINSILEDFQENKIRSSWTLAIKKDETLAIAKEKMIVYEFKKLNACIDTYNKLVEEYLYDYISFGYKGKLLFMTTSGVEESELKNIFSIELYNFYYSYNNLILDEEIGNIKLIEDYQIEKIENVERYTELLHQTYTYNYSPYEIAEDIFNNYDYLAIQLSYESINMGHLDSLHLKGNQLIIVYTISIKTNDNVPAQAIESDSETSDYSFYLVQIPKNTTFESYEFKQSNGVRITSLL